MSLPEKEMQALLKLIHEHKTASPNEKAQLWKEVKASVKSAIQKQSDDDFYDAYHFILKSYYPDYRKSIERKRPVV